ncbi:MAG: hypothetical protein ACSW8F_00390 [bacterium]
MERIIVLLFVLFAIGKATGSKFSSKSFIVVILVGILLVLGAVGSFLTISEEIGVFGFLASGEGIIILAVLILMFALGVRLLKGGSKGYYKHRRFEWWVDRFHDTWDSRNER